MNKQINFHHNQTGFIVNDDNTDKARSRESVFPQNCNAGIIEQNGNERYYLVGDDYYNQWVHWVQKEYPNCEVLDRQEITTTKGEL